MADRLTLPVLDRRTIERLEAAFPPRCMYPGEDLAAHHRYAGKVALVAALRAVMAERLEDHDETTEDDLLSGGERA